MYPTIAAASQRLKADSVLLDGEIVALGTDGKPSFQALEHGGANPGYQIVFYAFDVLHVNGQYVTDEPLVKRRAKLPAIVGDNATIRLSQVLPGSAADVVKAVRARGVICRVAHFPCVEDGEMLDQVRLMSLLVIHQHGSHVGDADRGAGVAHHIV